MIESILQILLWLVTLALFAGSLKAYIYSRKTKARLIAFAVRAWQRKRVAERELRFARELHAGEIDKFDERANQRAMRLRKTWDAYEIQEALELAGKRLMENRPCKDEHALVHRCFTL